MRMGLNYKYLISKYYPFKVKNTVPNILLHSTLQAFLVSVAYITGTFSILGVRPKTIRKCFNSINDVHSESNQVFLLAMFNQMGLK